MPSIQRNGVALKVRKKKIVFASLMRTLLMRPSNSNHIVHHRTFFPPES